MRRRALSAFAVVLGAGLQASGALAGTAALVQIAPARYELVYAAPAGQTNVVTVAHPSQSVWTVSDSAGVTAGSHCTLVKFEAHCSVAGIVLRTHVSLGDGNDTFSDTAIERDIVDGGTGDDRFRQGFVADGSDTLSGGPGTDTVDYRNRTQPLTVRVGSGADDGETGEQDDVQGDVEIVEGGSGNDLIRAGSTVGGTLNGNGGNDNLAGRALNDVLRGGAGVDFIGGDAGADVLDGGIGDDVIGGGAGEDTLDYSSRTVALSIVLLPGSSSGALGEHDVVIFGDVEDATGGSAGDTIVGSAGRNVLRGGAGDDKIAAGPGMDVLDGGSGADQLWTKDTVRDTGACGDGADIVLADWFDALAADCENIFRS